MYATVAKAYNKEAHSYLDMLATLTWAVSYISGTLQYANARAGERLWEKADTLLSLITFLMSSAAFARYAPNMMADAPVVAVLALLLSVKIKVYDGAGNLLFDKGNSGAQMELNLLLVGLHYYLFMPTDVSNAVCGLEQKDYADVAMKTAEEALALLDVELFVARDAAGGENNAVFVDADGDGNEADSEQENKGAAKKTSAGRRASASGPSQSKARGRTYAATSGAPRDDRRPKAAAAKAVPPTEAAAASATRRGSLRSSSSAAAPRVGFTTSA